MLIVVLGGGIDVRGTIPDHVVERLRKAIQLLNKNSRAKIVLSGKYSFLYKKERPSLTEAEGMMKYLLASGIPKEKIILEKRSKDTIGNAYYVKKYIVLPRKEKDLIIITSPFHLKRVEFVFKKIFGPSYKLSFLSGIESLPKNQKEKIIEHQKEVLAETKLLLAPMKDGDHHFLYRKIYNLSYYRKTRPDWVTNFVAKGK